jgi:N-acetylglucosamine kinase-like BadF-type ATPase
MIVIESGGTKSTWAYFDEVSSSVKLIETVGLHPREIDSNKTELIGELLKSNSNFQTTSQVYFYGAGCENQKGKDTIEKLFNSHGFSKVSVETDLKGACLALLGNQPGFTGILGTGAVAAQFDGKTIIKQTSGLGHLLGDEGSGFDIGKRLLNAYFSQDLPQNISNEIESFFSPEKDIIHRVYKPDGRMVIASLTHIVKKHSSEKVIQTILESAFTDYYNTALKKFSNISDINFIGSIAYHFENELISTLLKYNISVQKVHQTAIKPLFKYHRKHLT